jgi:hypothetical protein
MKVRKQEPFIMNLYPQLAKCSRAILKDMRQNSGSKQVRMLAHKLLTVRNNFTTLKGKL